MDKVTTVYGKKLHSLFCQLLCQITFYFGNFWRIDTGMNLQQNSVKIIHLS